MKDDVSNERSP